MNDKLQLPFEITKITTDFLDNTFNDYLRITDFLCVFFCMRGHIETSIDYKQYSISKGDMFIYTPSLFIHIISHSDDFSGIAIRTNYDYVVPLVNKAIDIRSQLLLRDHPYYSLTNSQCKNIEQQIRSIMKRIEQENDSGIETQRKKILTELIMSQGATLLYELMNICFTSQKLEPIVQDRGDLIIQKFMVSLYHHYNTKRNVAYYAHEQCLSPSYFCAVVKQKTGKTVSQWIIELVIVEAKQLLQYSDISVKEIAIHLNFPTQSFFGKYFKKYMGVSPNAYRKQFKSFK